MTCYHQESAFPFLIDHRDGEREFGTGITKREYFAALALAGFSANPEAWDKPHNLISTLSVEAADALIAALNQEQPK